MRHGRETDYQAPFKDIPFASDEAKIAHVVSIGRAELVDWWRRVKDDTSPGTYGQTDHEFTSSVAYLVNGGAISAYLYKTDRPKASVIAARLLGVEPNWK